MSDHSEMPDSHTLPGSLGSKPAEGIGRVALVTGVGGGLGTSIAVSLAAAGFDLVIHRLKSLPDEIQQVQDRVQRLGRRCAAIVGDLGDVAFAERPVSFAIERFGQLDVLVNNAAWDPGRVPLEECSPEFLNRIWAVNVRAPLLLIRAFVRALRARAARGSIVNISSIHCWQSVSGFAAYAASKGALESLTRQLAVELGPHGIRINAVAPAFVEVPRTIDGQNPANLTQVARRTPLQCNGQPEDVAALVAFLGSNAARWITGQTYVLDGGTSCVLPTHPLDEK